MKGRSPWNKPDTRKANVYKLLIQSGGEARWKTLKAHLQELRLGPTTLKQTLDKLVNEGSVTKEARLGKEGAEVWYKIQIKVDELWSRLERDTAEGLESPDSPDLRLGLFSAIREKAARLEGVEKDAYLFDQMLRIIKMASEGYIAYLYLYVRGAQFNDREQLDHAFDYIASEALLRETKTYQKFLSEYPKPSLRAIHSLLLVDKSRLDEMMRYEEEDRQAKLSKRRNADPCQDS